MAAQHFNRGDGVIGESSSPDETTRTLSIMRPPRTHPSQLAGSAAASSLSALRTAVSPCVRSMHREAAG